MGNNDSKSGASINSQNSKNQAAFKKLAKSKSYIVSRDLQDAWNGIISQDLIDIFFNFLFAKSKELRFNEYNHFLECLLQGTCNEKAELTMELFDSMNNTSHNCLQRYLQIIVRNVCLIESQLPKSCIKYWTNHSSTDYTLDNLISYYLSLTKDLEALNVQSINPIISAVDPFTTLIVGKLCGIHETCSNFFPKWLRLLADRDKTLEQCSILTLEDILFLNSLLPVDWQLEWRLLFSSKIHGESFSRLSGQIINQGPTLIIIKDKDGYVFGGFAPYNWSHNPKFVGDSSSFLFTLRPKMNVYHPSNFNENFQYLNQGQQTLPNGLGMGGKLEYFGLWLDSEYGIGVCNDSCTTFRNFARLSKEKEFHCAEVEVWGVGQPPASASELGERSVLDGNTEAKAMLELAGRKTYSDGLREEPKD